MKCPDCGTKVFEVLETRTRKTDRTIVRRKECGNGHRFTTEERIVVSKPKATGGSERDALSNLWSTGRDGRGRALKPVD
jgi:transcriptional regulator NrdR family protein